MTVTEWDGTEWGGTTVAEPIRVPSSAAKAITGPFAANVEFGTYLAPHARTPQAMMIRAQAAYHRNPWVGTAETVVTRRVAGLPWHLEDDADKEYEEPYPAGVREAFELLEKPQAKLAPEMRDPGLLTRRALISLTSRHMGLCNLAYWFLDQRDTNGLPLAILYVNPARVWPTTTPTGRIIGWVLDPSDEYGHGGTPLELSELLPFYLNPPDRGPYGYGLYERVMLKAQITNLADQHAAYVLGTGGRLAGIVAPKEGTIPEESYNALVREFRNVNEAPDAAKRTTILRGPVDFIQTAASPDDLNLVELDKLNRDDIFAVWGVPPSQAGIGGPAGLNSGETKGYDEAVLMQGAVHDRVVAIKETIQFGLLDRWLETGLTIDLEIEEPEFDDRTPQFVLAEKAVNLPLRNSERREILGLAPFGDAHDDEVWLPFSQQTAFVSTTNGPRLPSDAISTTLSREQADAVGALIRAGFDPGDALRSLGLPPIKHVGLLPITLQSDPIEAGVVDAALATAKGRREFLGLRRTVDTRWVPAVKRTVAGVLAGQRKEVAAKLRDASPDELARQRRNKQHWLANDGGLEKVLAPILAAIAEQVGDRTAAMLKPAKADPFTESVIARVLKKVGERIKEITSTTRDAVAAAVLDGFDRGLSPGQVADLIEDLPAFNENRAELVARTETMFAYNDAALTSFNEFGVTMVEAIDGDEDEECRDRVANNPYTLEEAMEIEDHPNGTLDWVPVLGKAATPVQADSQIIALLTALTSQKAETNIQVLLPDTIAIPAPVVHVSAPDVYVAAPEATVVPAPIVNVVTPPMRTVLDRDAKGKLIGHHDEVIA